MPISIIKQSVQKDQKVSFFLRVVSAILGLGLLFFTCYLFQLTGLLVLCSLVAFVFCLEFSFLGKMKGVEAVFFACVIFAFFLSSSFYSESFLILSLFFIFIVIYFIFLLEFRYHFSVRDEHDFSKSNGEEEGESPALWSIKSKKIQVQLNRMGWCLTGLFYCGLIPSLIMRGIQTFGYPYFISVLLISFSSDTFAYLGGRLFGKRHIAPLISPKKTLEGSLIGLGAGTLAGSLYLGSTDISADLIFIFGLSLTASVFGQMGDLFESVIKRYQGTKDSGVIMPGHGGALDRLDSVFFAGPVIYFWMLFL